MPFGVLLWQGSVIKASTNQSTVSGGLRTNERVEKSLMFVLLVQAVCFPYWYQEKVRRQTVKTITCQLVTPVVLLALFFNITKFIAISPLGTSPS